MLQYKYVSDKKIIQAYRRQKVKLSQTEEEQKNKVKIYQFEHVVIGKQATSNRIGIIIVVFAVKNTINTPGISVEYQNSQNKVFRGTHVVQSSKQIFLFYVYYVLHSIYLDLNTICKIYNIYGTLRQASKQEMCIYLFFFCFFQFHISQLNNRDVHACVLFQCAMYFTSFYVCFSHTCALCKSRSFYYD